MSKLLLLLRLDLVAPPRFPDRRCTLLRPAPLLLLSSSLLLLRMRLKMVELRRSTRGEEEERRQGKESSRPSTRSRRSPRLRVSAERPVYLMRTEKVTRVVVVVVVPSRVRLRWQKTRPRVVSDRGGPCPVHRRRRCYCLALLLLLLKWIVERRRKRIAGDRRKGAARGKEVGREGGFDRSRGARLSRRHCWRWEALHSFEEDLQVQLTSRRRSNRLLCEEQRPEEEEMEDGTKHRRRQGSRQRELGTRRRG